jgi:peptidoglycan hydrolase-like protein with peptidoglycan-binding domain
MDKFRVFFCVCIVGMFPPIILADEASASSVGTSRFVCEVQERLALLGFEPGPIDGIPGDKSREAAASFINFIKPKEETITDSVLLEYLRLVQKGLDSKNIKDAPSTVKRPENGKIYFVSGKEEVAPLEIKTPDQGYDFFVKLSEANGGLPVKAFYVRSGSTFRTKVPLGNYDIKYVTGENWYGTTCLFGLATLYSKADKVFNFEQKGNQVTGYSVELILQVDGNLSTKSIQPEDW